MAELSDFGVQSMNRAKRPIVLIYDIRSSRVIIGIGRAVQRRNFRIVGEAIGFREFVEWPFQLQHRSWRRCRGHVAVFQPKRHRKLDRERDDPNGDFLARIGQVKLLSQTRPRGHWALLS